MPAAGWALVLYSHGLGEDYRGFLRVAAEPMAARGAAVLGLDPPLQGARNPTGQDDRSLIIDLSINNILAGREILRQGVLDEVQAARLVQGGLTVSAQAAPDGVEARFDPARVAFMGHSEGAQIGALLLPLAPEIGGAVLSEGGGGAAITMIELNLDGIDIASLVALGLGIDDSVEALELGHPVVSAVIQPLLDPADPLHVARELFREPKAGAGHDLVMLEGFNDPLTPPPAIEALAAAAQLPIAEPVAREIAALTLQGVASSPLPASGNLPGPAGATFTGGLLQFPNQGHYIVYFNEPARARMFDFLATSLAGDAVLSP
jgi:pimeloyl-ACP methyl ester carboxylesterase